MKDFKDFEATISSDKLNQISNEIIDKLNNIESKLDIIEFERSFNYSLMMRILKEYHNWLNN